MELGRNRGVLDMHVGLTMFPTDYSIPPHDLAVAAEARGYESLWLPEHSHIPTSRKSPWPGGAELPKYYYDSYDPFVSLAAAAAVTKTIKLATGICLVVERDPIHTAKEVSTVDQLSSGRFIFGVGGGWNEEEMANHGTAFATRFKLMGERIQAMKQIWTQSTAAFDGAKTSAETIAAPIQVTAVKSSSQCASSEINPAASGKPWVGGPCDTPLRDGPGPRSFTKKRYEPRRMWPSWAETEVQRTR